MSPVYRVEGPLAGIRRPSAAGSALACPSILFLLLSLRYLRINYPTEIRLDESRAEQAHARHHSLCHRLPLPENPADSMMDNQRGQKFDFAIG